MCALWVEPTPISVDRELRQAVGGHPILSELLTRRGITTRQAAAGFLDPQCYSSSSPFELPDMRPAIERLARALGDQEPLVVWGDFDVDGQTATTILVSSLTRLGFRARYHVPHRVDESHGLNIPALEELRSQGIRLILTCDCGVADVEELRYCRQHGIDVIVTDHHDLPVGEVPAVAVVNPRRLESDHPLSSLCGAGVAFKLAQGLFEHFRRAHLSRDVLDLAALGTVADVVPLVDENRYLVQVGLPLLFEGRRVGLKTLIKVAGIGKEEGNPWDTEPIAYELAPALNAAGRLAHAEIAVKLLLTEDRKEAEQLALQIVDLNEERRLQTRLAEGIARDIIEAMPRPLPAALVLAHKEWHPGVIGIVAGRLSESYGRPAVMISLNSDFSHKGAARASARSVPGVDIHQAIVDHRHLLVSEGGHPMAAGFGILPEKIPELGRLLQRSVERQLGGVKPQPTVVIEGWVDWGELNLDLCDQIFRLAPFGEGNRMPVLAARNLSLISIQALGDSGENWKLRLADSHQVEGEVIWWRGDKELLPRGHDARLDVAFTMRPNVYRDRRRLQLTLVDVRHSPPALVTVARGIRRLSVLDQRGSTAPEKELMAWIDRAAGGQPLAIWGEGKSVKEISGLHRRDNLTPAEKLVIWTVPPGPHEFSRALERSGAGTVVLLFGDSPAPRPVDFLTDLMGRVKYTLKFKAGWAEIDSLAGSMAARRNAVLVGLQLLGEQAGLTYDLDGSDGLVFHGEPSRSLQLSRALQSSLGEDLRFLLRETQEYRSFLLEGALPAILPEPYGISETPAGGES